MGPKREQELEQAVIDLEHQVFDFLTMGSLLGKADAATRQLYLDDPDLAMNIPELYLMYRKLEVFSPGNGIPFLVEGGWYDQPYVLCRGLEACAKAQRDYYDLLRSQQRQMDGKQVGTEQALAGNPQQFIE